jgi:hypothetical protein
MVCLFESSRPKDQGLTFLCYPAGWLMLMAEPEKGFWRKGKDFGQSLVAATYHNIVLTELLYEGTILEDVHWVCPCRFLVKLYLKGIQSVCTPRKKKKKWTELITSYHTSKVIS